MITICPQETLSQEGLMMGGSGVVITRGPAKSPTKVNAVRRRGAYYICSYDEEVLALEATMDWLETHKPGPVAIITDNQSLCMALLGVRFKLDQLRLRLKNYSERIIIQWAIKTFQAMIWQTRPPSKPPS